ncbi:MAG: RNA polymerase sigma factor [Candidatus Pacebacteria bacterium]|nr:RNA polymerase sigma factor [Candidatus Paceibacterota bacterium]
MEDDNLIQKTDEELTLLVKGKEIDIFGILISRYESKMIRYARKFISNQEEIEDIVQNIFLKVYRNIQLFDSGRKFSTWLYAIAHNEIVNFLKKSKKWPVALIDPDTFWPSIADNSDLTENIFKEEESKILKEKLDILKPKYKEIIVLFYLEELDYAQISEILKIPISTVGVRLRRAREILKQKFNNHGK